MDTVNEEIVKNQIKKARFWLIANVAFFIVLISVVIFFTILNKNNTDFRNRGLLDSTSAVSDSKNEITISLKTETRLIDGVLVEKASTSPQLFGVMIDNHVDARPPSGLAKASLVFEAEAEGGITRYLAFFPVDEKLEEIGPIRSARPYFVDWAEEFNALYLHVGGSPDALTKIINDRVPDANEFYNAPYFWRDHTRSAPHNVYTSTDLIAKYISKKKISLKEIDPWQFKDDALKETLADSKEVKIDFRVKGFKVTWKYDKEKNIFFRQLDDKPHLTMDGVAVSAKNVIVMYAKSKEIDEKLRLDLVNIGKGKATICLDSQCRVGTWKKSSSRSRTRFYIEDVEVVFNRGTTWIEVVKPSYEVVIK